MSLAWKGKGLVETAAGALDVDAYVTFESLKANHAWEEEIVKDAAGADAAWVPRNEHIILDVNVKLAADTIAHAKAGGAFLAPYAAVVFSGGDLSFMNATWQYIGGASIDLSDAKHGSKVLKLRKYADSAQNTAAVTAAT